ncbi:MAG TPA: UDP-2,3-diacylglucosamine diphosphatase [Rhizomicrobium sp.]|jgi:UDP-2,3-diacylglucosamine pyrophosphatase LpxH|nr:UDP-2,3-diacylglucosamine diphosphatase [Rhizomicrobium sp.]
MAEIAWSQGRPSRLPEAWLRTAPRRHPARGAPHAPQQGMTRHRTIFISDIHLGTRGCKAELLADFLARNSCDTLFLVGDIVDGWRLKRRWFWPEAHNRVLEELLHKIDTGTRVIYVPGNHDEVLRAYCGRVIAGVELMEEAVHETADGRRLLVLHGDRFDAVIAYAKWLAHLGDGAYTLALHLNEVCHTIRRRLGLEYWSLSSYLKQKVKNALEYICRFEAAVARDVKARGFDGVVCGHIHHAAIKTLEGVLYINDGDWVESCTALVEDMRGNLEILHWASAAAAHDPVALGAVRDELVEAVPA